MMKFNPVIKALTCSALLTLTTSVYAADPIPAAATTAAVADDSQAVIAFEAKLQAAVEKGGYYPMEAVRNGEQGTVEVEFDYAGDGRATNVTLGATTASGHLNGAAVRSVEKAKLPPKPPELAGISHFRIKLTYALH